MKRDHFSSAAGRVSVTAMRVDEAPLLIKPAFHAYGYGAGALFQAIQQALRATCRFERSPCHVRGPRIECIWHEHLPTYIAAYLPPRDGRRYVWMNHPVWTMRPVHLLLYWSGVEELALGSSGHGGQQALERLVEALSRGYSTLVAVDGPAGPPHVLKRGALELAQRTGLPLVAIRFAYERAVRVPGWDRKHYPLPGSRVQIVESEPLRVDAEGLETCRDKLIRALG